MIFSEDIEIKVAVDDKDYVNYLYTAKVEMDYRGWISREYYYQYNADKVYSILSSSSPIIYYRKWYSLNYLLKSLFNFPYIFNKIDKIALEGGLLEAIGFGKLDVKVLEKIFSLTITEAGKVILDALKRFKLYLYLYSCEFYSEYKG